LIENAQILRIDTLGAPSASGDRTFVNGSSISVDCCLDAPTSAQIYQLGATIEGATSVVYVDFDPELAIAPGNRITVFMYVEPDVPLTLIVMKINGPIGGEGLSHWELFARAA